MPCERGRARGPNQFGGLIRCGIRLLRHHPFELIWSKRPPRLDSSAGARLMLMTFCGKSNPALINALRTRSRLSFTLVSARPTMLTRGRPPRQMDLDVDRRRLDAHQGAGVGDCEGRSWEGHACCVGWCGGIVRSRRGDCCQRLVTHRVREMLRVCQSAPSRLWQPPGSRAMLRPVSVRPRSLCTRLMHPDRALLALFIHKPLIPVRFVELAQSVQMQWSPFDARSPVA